MNIAFINGKIATMGKEGEFVEALGIENEKICIVGSNDIVLSIKNDDTKIIDLEGRLMVPGFNDSHMHLLNYGYSKSMIQLYDVASVDEIIEFSKDALRNNSIGKNGWIIGRGWNQDYFIDKRFPTREDLDKISTDIPICVIRTCGHMLVANSVAINLALRSSKDMVNVDIDKGFFFEDGCKYIYDVIGSPDLDEVKEIIVSASKDLIKGGITSVQSDDLMSLPDGDFKKVLKAYEQLADENKLPLRVYEQSLLPNKDLLIEFLSMGYATGIGNSFFKIGPLKLLLDGSLGARTALIYGDYLDDPSTSGVAVYTEDELKELVDIAMDKKMQIAIHAIGDKAIDICVDTIINAGGADDRNGIVHCQLTTDEIMEKMAENKILAYVQPIFLDYDLHIVEERIGKERASKTYAWKTMIDKGIHISGGSDCPVVDYNVLENIYSAVTRKDLKGAPINGWLEEEKLTVYEALELFTSKASYCSFEEDVKGKVECGMLADLVVLSKDLFTIPSDDIKDVTVDMTIVNGCIVYR